MQTRNVGVRIVENYRDYTPPAWIRSTVERLVASLSPEHIGGLDCMILTNGSAIGRGKTRRVRGRKFQRRECRGFYNPGGRNARPFIELVVDNVIGNRRLPNFKLIRDVIVADTLYHEIGHHLHSTVGSARRGGEASADDWAERLTELHMRRQYRWMNSIARIINPIAKPLMTIITRHLSTRRRTSPHRA